MGPVQIFELLREKLDALAEGGVHVTTEGVTGAGPSPVPLDQVDRFEVREVREDGHHPGWGYREGLTPPLASADGTGPYERLVLVTRGGRVLRIPTGRHHDLGNVALRLNHEVSELRRRG